LQPGEEKVPVKLQADATMLVIGIGSPFGGDDSAGRAAVHRIQEMEISSLHALEHDGDGASLMDLWKEFRSVIVVDAVSSGSNPGTIHRFDPRYQSLPARIAQGSTHAFGLHEAVELARVLGQLPSRLIVYGIEGKSFAWGGELSPEVRRALPDLIDCVLQEADLQ
jgi:hydrogenase maturation protease